EIDDEQLPWTAQQTAELERDLVYAWCDSLLAAARADRTTQRDRLLALTSDIADLSLRGQGEPIQSESTAEVAAARLLAAVGYGTPAARDAAADALQRLDGYVPYDFYLAALRTAPHPARVVAASALLSAQPGIPTDALRTALQDAEWPVYLLL